MHTCDGETAESPLLLQCLCLCNSGLRGDDNWVLNETVLVALDLGDHLGLVVGRAVVVDHAQTTEQGHVDSHVVLGNCVHGRRNERSLERDLLGDWCVEGHLSGSEACDSCQDGTRKSAILENSYRCILAASGSHCKSVRRSTWSR